LARYVNEQNRVALKLESGTYGNASGTAVWIGKVTSNAISENFNIQEERFLGTSDRGVSVFEDTAKDFEGTLTYYPQNMRMLGYALGSATFTTGASNTWAYATVNNDARQNAYTSGTLNPFISFQIEDGKMTQGGSFVRTAQGCMVDTMTVSASQGDLVSAEVSYLAQNMTDSVSGPSSVTVNGSRTYMWKDIIVQIPAGTTLDSVTDMSLEVANNFERPHYLNGSSVIGIPIPLNRDVTLSITANLQTENIALYNNYYKSGTSFNAVIDMNANPGALAAIGSMHSVITLSGCRIMSADIPSETEGVSTTSLEIKAGSVSVLEYNQEGDLY